MDNNYNQQPYNNQYSYDTPTYKSQPDCLGKWNWGAFSFNFMWGLGNETKLPLLVLIPIFNIVWIFVCGAKGNEWAWNSGKFPSADAFDKAQETWNRGGMLQFIIGLIGVVVNIGIVLLVIAMFATSFSW